MSRPSHLWQRQRDGMWMTTIHGAQHKLSLNKTEARKALDELLAADAPAPRKAGISTRKVCDNSLVKTAGRKEPETLAAQATRLSAFCEEFGPRDPAGLLPENGSS